MSVTRIHVAQKTAGVSNFKLPHIASLNKTPAQAFTRATDFCKGPFTQAIFAAIFLLLMHAIKWINLRIYYTICAKLYKSILV